MVLISVIISTTLVSLISLIGVIFLILKREIFAKIIFFLISLATGALLGGSLIHLLPHSLEKIEPLVASWLFILGFVFFFMLERIFRWRHCHELGCEVHPVTYLSLIGDSLHNLIDGVIIATSFLVDIKFGIVTTLVVLAHEVPQELGDYAILIFGGVSKEKALFLNFLTSITAVIGGIFGFFFFKESNLIYYLLPFVAGNFLYISASDLVPELHSERDFKKSINSFFLFIAGIFIVFALKLIFE
ncbi:MAG: ZIP family metal transporter [Candidatus Hydrothermales bacterium]